MQYPFKLFNSERQVEYFVLSVLDEGGFGQVWHGVMSTGLDVAIKVIKPSADFNRDLSSWFTDQQIHLQCLNHPHVVTTYDQFISGDQKLVIVMELGRGSLESLIDRGTRFSTKVVCGIACQILSALQHVHNLGVIHRDVTLNNIIWFDGGVYKLCDFGISKPNLHLGDYARTFIGKRSYIPPELLGAGYTTYQSDIYQLGLVLLTLLTGRHPISPNATDAQTRHAILTGVPRQIAESLVPVHGRTVEIISIMLRRRDAYRYKTASQALVDFDAELKRCEDLDHRIANLALQPWWPFAALKWST
ncbi:MAG: serine/threonine protein kinase [Verrucomicrobia bacterium]|nr:serine/threonine protein kinase [Verrucomicrobiota bacterium]